MGKPSRAMKRGLGVGYERKSFLTWHPVAAFFTQCRYIPTTSWNEMKWIEDGTSALEWFHCAMDLFAPTLPRNDGRCATSDTTGRLQTSSSLFTARRIVPIKFFLANQSINQSIKPVSFCLFLSFSFS